MHIFVDTVYCLDKRDTHVSSFPIAYSIDWSLILDIPSCKVDSKSTNQSSESLHRSKAAHASIWHTQVFISLRNVQHVLIDCLICNLLANIVNQLH